MRFVRFCSTSYASLWLSMLLLPSTHASGAQDPGPPVTAQPKVQPQQRDNLAKQIEELRQADKFDEAVPIAERPGDGGRAGGEKQAGEAEAVVPSGRTARVAGGLEPGDGTAEGSPGGSRARMGRTTGGRPTHVWRSPSLRR